MIRFLIIRVLFPLLLIWFIQALAKSLFSGLRSVVTQPPRQTPGFQTGGELKKDPVCGTYVAVEGSVTKSVNGELMHFCSAACRDKYRAA